MLTRQIMRWGMLVSGTLFAIDFSPCGPTGELMELLLPMAIMGLAT